MDDTIEQLQVRVRELEADLAELRDPLKVLTTSPDDRLVRALRAASGKGIPADRLLPLAEHNLQLRRAIAKQAAENAMRIQTLATERDTLWAAIGALIENAAEEVRRAGEGRKLLTFSALPALDHCAKIYDSITAKVVAIGIRKHLGKESGS